MRYFLVFFMSFALVACQYEVSPWSTDPDCPANVSVAANIERLQVKEAAEGDLSSFKAAIISDPQAWPGSFDDAIKHINGLNVDLVLLTGDLTETGIKEEFEWTCLSMSKSKAPIIAVIGNHDAISFGDEIWQKVFGEFDFAFTYQNVKFIAYNDNKYEFPDVPDRSWLAAEAAEKASNPDINLVIGFSHIMPWDDDTGFDQHLVDSGFDLTLHGHNHAFDFWLDDEVGLPHYVVSWSRDIQFGLLTIHDDATYQLEDCTPQCTVVVPRTRN